MTSDQLAALHDNIWLVPFSRRLTAYSAPQEHRALKENEVAAVLDAARSGKYLITMSNACMGFGIAMSLHTPSPYPGAMATHVITITNKHLSDTARFEDGWSLFSPIALADDNQRRLEFEFGERLPTDKSHYDY